jgi:CRP/FNR family transcriptional regulator, cyclic AMP receptor protein
MPEPSLKKFLADNDFFAGLASEYIDFLAGHAKIRQVATNEVIFHYGEKADHFYLIASGEVSVQVVAIEGPALELQSLGPGAVIGWSWLISPYKWSFQARATTPAEVLEFDGEAVLSHCEEDPRFGYELLKRFSTLMSERLQFARRKMMQEWKPQGFA